MKVEIGETYRHQKGHLYKAIAIATHSETQESLVIYRSIADDRTWARPMLEFCDGRFTQLDYYEGDCPSCGSELVEWDDDEDKERCLDCNFLF